MNRGEAIRKLKRKMKKECFMCNYIKSVYGVSKPTLEDCYTKCWVYYFTNLMLEELNGN